jgi:general secretion pathway protein G
MQTRQKGFTLLEIMVVVVILGILAAAAAPKFLESADKAKVNRAKSDMQAIGGQLKMYKLDNHRYPTQEQGLEALVTKPSSAPEPKKYPENGYMERVPSDPWGGEYIYIYPGENGDFDIISLGGDGQEGGEGYDADLGNWME